MNGMIDQLIVAWGTIWGVVETNEDAVHDEATTNQAAFSTMHLSAKS
jgi:hypothetical protein